MRKLVVAVMVAVLLGLAAPVLAAPIATGQDDPASGTVVQFGRDAVVSGDPLGMVVVVGGDLDLTTAVGTVIVIDGSARLVGATVGTVVIVDGTVDLDGATQVDEVWLSNADLTRDEGAVITDGIRRAGDRGFASRWVTRLIFALGLAMLVIVVGLAAAAIAPVPMGRAARQLTESPGQTMVAALIAWLAIPLALVLVAVSFVGLPTALVIWLCLLPLLGVVGFAVTGLRIGQAILKRTESEGQPLMATFVGVLTLVVLGQIPGLGWLITVVAGFVGGGAVALSSWRSIRGVRPKIRTDDVPLLPA